MNRRKPGWRFAVAVPAVLAVAVAVVAVWRAWTPGAEVNLADVVAVSLAGAMLAGAVVAWARRSALPAGPAGVTGAGVGPADVTGAGAGAAAQVLAGLVERQWRAEARNRLLDDPGPIPVHWQLIADATVMSQPRLITFPTEPTDAASLADAKDRFGPALTGRSDAIAAFADAFRGLRQRRLVITGGAGMGKTTLAIQLLLRLLAMRAADRAGAGEGQPVPVLLPVSGWDTDAHPRLQDWLAVRLAADYPALAAPELGAGAAAALAEGGHVLPVLDGLDEIPPPARTKVLAALNASLTARDQLILTSRRKEFTTAVRETGRPLTAAAVIVPKPITPEAAADYLAACLPAVLSGDWTRTLDALRSRALPGLTRLAATPLGLWLIRTVYLTPEGDPVPLTGPLGDDADALRAHLLDQLIPALIKARPPSTDPAHHFRPRRVRDPDVTRRHLTSLARAFPPGATRDITWWHIARTTPHIRSAVGLTTGIAFGLVAALAFTLTLGIAFGMIALDPSSGVEFGIDFTTGIGMGISFGLASGLVRARSWVDERPGRADLRLRGRTALLLRSIMGALAVGLKIGCWVGLTIAAMPMVTVEFDSGVVVRLDLADFDAAGGLQVGAAAWLGITLASGLITWAEQPTLESTSTPRSSLRADRALSLLRMVVTGLLTGVLFGLVAGLVTGPGGALIIGVAVGIGSGLTFGLAAGFVMGNHHAWLVLTIAVARLALEHRLPWRIMDFLDDAHRLGLLRAVGPVYQFRHAALHDHLAAGRDHER
ncbi:NACHT domain-containing protein [Nonomuraea gerenzanensis]|uniref:NACHT domain-containing protein n=1 Tax=Nonomuraea gerenzanensis TaxID=93944 RepID=UPI001CDA09F1|nr:NACHT domain-containing protein [Nonomuraea gerenzanensis]UBU18352.1 NACHT domain-containing protein [Nonomuraea gerenzanensis]